MSLWTPLPQNIAPESIIPRLNGKMEAMVRQLVRFSPKDALTFHQDAVAASQSSVALEGGLIDETAPYTPTGGEVLIQSQDISGTPAAVDFTTGIDATYNEYVFRITGLQATGTAENLFMRTSTDGGSTWDSGAADYKVGVSNYSQVQLTSSTMPYPALSNSLDGELRLFRPSDASYYTAFMARLYDGRNGNFYNIGGYRASAADVDGVRFYVSGTLAAGTIKLFGVLG